MFAVLIGIGIHQERTRCFIRLSDMEDDQIKHLPNFRPPQAPKGMHRAPATICPKRPTGYQYYAGNASSRHIFEALIRIFEVPLISFHRI